LWDEREKPISEPNYPRLANGDLLAEIPFVFIGATDNTPTPDNPPISDLADACISWYQVSADHMENLHIHGQITAGISTPMDYEQFKQANPNGIAVGARSFHFLGDGGSFDSITAPESSSLSKALEDIKADMIAIGGRLIQPKTGQMTAQEARIQAASEMSVLETVVKNVSDGLTKASQWVALFMGAEPDGITFELNRDFWDKIPDAQLITVIMGLEDRGHMAQSDVTAYLRKVGILAPERTDEDIAEEASQTVNLPSFDGQ